MAIVPITKIRIFSYRHDVAKMLEIAQKIGAIEFKKVEEIEGFLNESNTPNTLVSESNSKLANISRVITFLSNYEEKLGTFAKLRKGSLISISETQLNKDLLNESELESVLLNFNILESRLNNIKTEINLLKERRFNLIPWQSLKVPLGSLKTKRTNTYLFKIKNLKSNKAQSKLSLVDLVTELLGNFKIESYIVDAGKHYFSVTVPALTDVNSVIQAIKSIGGEAVNLFGYTNTPIKEIELLEAELTNTNKILVEINEEIALFTINYLRQIKLAHEVLVWSCDRQAVYDVTKTTKHITFFEGWADKYNLQTFKKQITEAGLLCSVIEVPLDKDEIPPVEIKNHKLIQPFEIITRLNGLPGHKDIDPTPFMAGFFLLFFGLALTDVGYGFLLVLVSLLILFYFSVAPAVKMFGKLLLMMGVSTMIIGMFFGGYFGISMSHMPKFLQDLQMFDPIANPLPVFYLALAVGVVQVMFGLMLKILREVRNGQIMTGLLDQGPWLLLFTSLILYGASTLGYVAGESESFVTLIYVSVALVLISSGRSGKTLLGKIQMSLLSIYNSVNFFSDILSYSRLLALGLATSALAFAVNLIAGIVYEMIPYVGVIFAVLVLLVGHTFTLVINTLGSFIHSARLQFVEFFGKFIVGTGKAFKPLTRRESYINFLKEDSG